MKKRIVCPMVLTMALVFGTSCSSKEAEDVQETGAASTAVSVGVPSTTTFFSSSI